MRVPTTIVLMALSLTSPAIAGMSASGTGLDSAAVRIATQRLLGPWTVSGGWPHMGREVVISSPSTGVVEIRSARGFSAVGFFDGQKLTAIVDHGGGQLEWLKAQLGNDDRLTVLMGGPCDEWTELEWTRGHAPPLKPQGNRLPTFGEYVYVEELPEARDKVQPDYPADARAKGIDGTVMVQALVGRDGFVKKTLVVKSIKPLDAAAVAAVKRWRFKPAMAEGEPVAVWVAVPIRFSLH
jgi:TonB family protein